MLIGERPLLHLDRAVDKYFEQTQVAILVDPEQVVEVVRLCGAAC